MPRRSHLSIPHELHQLIAQRIYERRRDKGINRSPEEDWKTARRYLTRYPKIIETWKRNRIRRVFTFLFWLLDKLPQLFANKETRPFALDVVKTVISGASLIAAIIAAAGLFINYQDALKDRQLTQERLVSDRFTKAVAQLGNSKEEVIIGGIYSLERIAKDSPKDQWTIMEVLTAFVQKNSEEEKSKELNKFPEVNRQVQAALTVIERRNPEQDYTVDENPKTKTKRLDLRYSNLVQSDLFDANLRNADLSEANLRGAYLRSADLRNAKLFDSYFAFGNLSSANLSSANLGGANLSGANLTGVNLEDANLNDANLTGVNLNGANLNNVENLSNDQIKMACFWDKVIYTDAKWNRDKWSTVDEIANQERIEDIRQDGASDPANPPDCSRWKIN